MVRYIGKRLLMMIPVLLGIVLIVFCMNHISSGNPARMLLGVGASDEAIAALEEELGVSMPAFWAGMMLILLFSITLKWLPVSGLDGWKNWVLPTFTSSMVGMATITRMTRSSMLEVICQEYIVTARAKGLTEKAIIVKHALKNALIPIITVLGIQLGIMLGGAVLTETVFSINGLGKYMVDGIKNRDYPVVQGGVLLLAMVFSLVNLLVDIIYAYADPRIKSQYSRSKRRSS